MRQLHKYLFNNFFLTKVQKEEEEEEEEEEGEEAEEEEAEEAEKSFEKSLLLEFMKTPRVSQCGVSGCV